MKFEEIEVKWEGENRGLFEFRKDKKTSFSRSEQL